LTCPGARLTARFDRAVHDDDDTDGSKGGWDAALDEVDQ